MKRLRCYLGWHCGHVAPAYELDEDIDGHSAFVCDHCGKVIE